MISEHGVDGARPSSSPTPAAAQLPDAQTGADPYLWLEDIDGGRALDFVHSHNARAEEQLAGSPRFTALRREILDVLDAEDRLPLVTWRGDLLYNFWTDAQHERGIWRRTTMEGYTSDPIPWETLLDIDALNEAEGTSWVWKGANVLFPSNDRALVFLSPGGTDATVVREFDLLSKTFVTDGFVLPLSKGGATWADSAGSALIISRDAGEGSLTRSGYPRTVRRWERGADLSDAPVLFEGTKDDVLVGAYVDHTEGFSRMIIRRAVTFYTTQTFLVEDGETHFIDVPESAEVRLHREWLTILLREPWKLPHLTHEAGTLLGVRLSSYLAGSRDLAVLFEPTPQSSLLDATWTRSHLLLTILDDVKHRIDILTPPIAAPDAPAATATPAGEGEADDANGTAETLAARAWRRRPTAAQGLTEIVGDGAGDMVCRFPSVTLIACDARVNDGLWCLTEGFLTPKALTLLDLDKKGLPENARLLKRAPARFDTTGLGVSQHFVLSEDGTRVPYFQIGPADAAKRPSKPRPTLLYGYGGFEVAQLPTYSGVVGRAWLQRGGVYVVANIRGGGEYGPSWHRSALRQNRHRSYEDFAAIAQDLVDRGVTTPQQLGARGGSNGGLLMGNMLTTYPQLFGALVCQVPLLDMRRFSRLLAGASWMAEYGDPDEPTDWNFLRRYSAYHGVKPDGVYPPMLLTTSTRDDRVHPGHARKMTALLEALGKDVLFWENTEGGHGGAASNAQRATMNALAYEFLLQRLAD